MNKESTHSKIASTHRSRRTRYTLFLSLAVIAAFVIVILTNLIVDRGFRSLSEKSSPATKFLRYDFTATRQYSLSPQTLKVLKSLQDDYRLVSVINPNSLQTQRILDLANEYRLYSNCISTEQINPETNQKSLEAFYNELENRYAEKLKPINQKGNPPFTSLSSPSVKKEILFDFFNS